MKIEKKRYKEIKKIANGCQEFLSARNPLDAIKKLGISLSIINLDGVAGFTHINEKEEPHVYINKRYEADELSIMIVAAHELGHALLHRGCLVNSFDENKVSYIEEYEADVFLMELMPQMKPYSYDYRDLSPEELRTYIRSYLDV